MKFRYKAMQRMREPDELDAPTTLSAPRGWVAVMVVLIVMIGALIWGFAGRLPVSLTASGMLTTSGGTATVQSPYAGAVVGLPVHSTQAISAGQVVADVQPASGGTAMHVVSPFDGNVVSIAVSEGQVISAGDTVVTVERTGGAGDHVVVMLFVPSAQANELVKDQPVDLSVSAISSSEFGLLRGRIDSVGAYPLTSGALAGLVGGELAAQSYTGSGAPRLVVVGLLADPSTKSGLAWSTNTGPPFTLRTQVAVTGTIVIASRSPISLLFGR